MRFIAIVVAVTLIALIFLPTLRANWKKTKKAAEEALKDEEKSEK